MILREYDRAAAVKYAKKWALFRNPLFYDFDGIGGDCTNFISQCLFAGSCAMNMDGFPDWYYYSVNSRAPAWTGVEFLHTFLCENDGAGPYGREVRQSDMEPGDIIQLGDGGIFYHSLMVTGVSNGETLVCAHTYDALDRPLSSYYFSQARYIRVDGVRAVSRYCGCFNPLLAGRALICTP